MDTDRGAVTLGFGRISLVVFLFGELFELCAAGVDQVIQGPLCSLQVPQLPPQGPGLLTAT